MLNGIEAIPEVAIVVVPEGDESVSKVQVILSKLRKVFDFVKKHTTSECLKELKSFEKKLISYLREKTTEPSNIDDICKWIEMEFSKVVSRGESHKFAFLSTLVSAVIHSSFRLNVEELYYLDQAVFRRWAPILHRYFTEVDVAACQVLIFYIQDWVNIYGNYPKTLLYNILRILFENKKFLSFVVGDHRKMAILLSALFS